MTPHLTVYAALALASAAALSPVVARAQVPGLPTETSGIRHNSGESVTPYFEGWMKNADGTFDLVFGYFNRNYVQEFAIAAGPNNFVEAPPLNMPGGAPPSIDRGQPTYFLPRRQRYVYRVRVPADFGKREVVWSVTANGRTERAYGSLIAAEEITERVVTTNGNYDPGLNDPNKPPSIAIAPIAAATAGKPVTLTALVTDDGLPKPRRLPPAADPKAATGGFGGQVNATVAARPQGLTVSWLQYSGPAKVTFAQTGALPVENGQAMTTATFAAPGTYKLIASATDPGRLSTKTDVVVTVTKP
jgi:hypothetical protein